MKKELPIRRFKMTRLNHVVESLTVPLIRKRRFPSTRLIHDWTLIVGEKLARLTVPRKVTYYTRGERTVATLHIDVGDSGTAMHVTYLEPVILEKIAIYTGFKSIHRLRSYVRPGLISDNHEKTHISEPHLSEEQKEKLIRLLADIEDESLKEKLFQLGRHIL